jgi:hypothetical protein
MNNQRVAGFLKKPLIDLKGRRSIARSYFQSLIDSDNYEYLGDPIDVAAYEGGINLPLMFGYRFRAGVSVVASVVVGYQGSDAQKVIDVVYEVCSHTFPSSES